MAEFTLDTSGFVEGRPEGIRTKRLQWSDLDAFTQGYVEAVFATEIERGEQRWIAPLCEFAHFSDLAPETLAAILKDCAGVKARVAARLTVDMSGADFWEGRKLRFPRTCAEDRGFLVAHFPPLTVTLGDDGKVYLRGGQANG